MKHVDERDIMFSRLGYEKGSKIYEKYYSEHPEKKGIDDMLRARPGYGEPGTVEFDEMKSPIGNAGFEFLSDIKHLAEKKPNAEPRQVDNEKMTQEIKKAILYFGADMVGITEVKPEHLYTHRGRPQDVWGQVVDDSATHAIVFAVEMDEDMINKAPGVESGIEGVKSYVSVAMIGLWISYYIRSFGYEARTHMDGNYLAMVQKMAVDAGLGEIGKSGLVLTRKFGPRIRLGAVTTNMQLLTDERDDIRVGDVCLKCMRCVEKCPSKAIPEGGRTLVDGKMEWPALIPEKCYMVWSRMGTDCSICMAECPFNEALLKKTASNLQVKEKKAANDFETKNI